jgi:hypothetical protein
MFLITLSNDVNINPEPSTSDSLYPCGSCDKPVTWDGEAENTHFKVYHIRGEHTDHYTTIEFSEREIL